MKLASFFPLSETGKALDENPFSHLSLLYIWEQAREDRYLVLNMHLRLLIPEMEYHPRESFHQSRSPSFAKWSLNINDISHFTSALANFSTTYSSFPSIMPGVRACGPDDGDPRKSDPSSIILHFINQSRLVCSLFFFFFFAYRPYHSCDSTATSAHITKSGSANAVVSSTCLKPRPMKVQQQLVQDFEIESRIPN